MLRIGWAKRDFSMEGPCPIGGQFFERLSTGILDPVTVTALCLESEGAVSIMLSVDATAIRDGVGEEIRSEIRRRDAKVPTDRILFFATHTHTSPRYERKLNYDAAPHDRVERVEPETIRRHFVAQAASAIVEAYHSLAEGQFSYGYDYAVVAHHRRATYKDDLRLRPENQNMPASLAVNRHAKMYGNTCDENFLGYEGPVDSTVNFLYTFDRDGKLTGAVINVPCPSQNSEQECMLSADYWHEVRELLREKYGEIFILPQCAAAGDMSPRPLHGLTAEARRHALKYADRDVSRVTRPREMLRRREIAERIVASFDEALAWASKEKIATAPLQHRIETLTLPSWPVTEEMYLAAKREYEQEKAKPMVQTDDPKSDYKVNTKQSCVVARYRLVMDSYENSDTRTAECHAIRLGPVAFFSCPFELYVNFQHALQAQSPFTQTFLVQLAEKTDASGYLCTEIAKENMGYSAIVNSCQVAPSGGRKLVQEAVRILHELYE